MLMLALEVGAGFNKIHMLQQAQKISIEQIAVRLTDEHPLFGETPSRGVYMRSELLRISGRHAIQMEWGNILPDPEVSLEFLERLANISSAIGRLARKITIDDEWGCWALPLKRDRDEKGRGKYPLVTDKANDAQSMVAHRYTWKLLIDSDISTDDYLDHLCRIHACCNIAHLEPVSSSINTKRGNDARHILGGQDVLFHPD